MIFLLRIHDRHRAWMPFMCYLEETDGFHCDSYDRAHFAAPFAHLLQS